MSLNKVILLACGSYNPPTNMHLRMFELAKDHLHRLGNYSVLGGLISPVHDAYGKAELVSSTHRIEMIKLALQTTDWIKLSDWETKQESWSKTRTTLQYHQNKINSLLNDCNYNDTPFGLPDNWNVNNVGQVHVKLLCGADLLESFGTPGLWADEDIEAIVGQYGLIVITRSNTDPLKFIYNSDILTKYMANIIIVTEWISNDISSTRIRRALRRCESVKYLLTDAVIEYIHKHGIYGTNNNNKYLAPFYNNAIFLTPSPTIDDDTSMESPINNRCINLCNNNLFASPTSIDQPDSATINNKLNIVKHPGQAVKIITETSGAHKILTLNKEVCTNGEDSKALKASKSCTEFAKIVDEGKRPSVKRHSITTNNTQLISSKSNESLECKSCDENLIKFIFTKHGIQVISDVETIV